MEYRLPDSPVSQSHLEHTADWPAPWSSMEQLEERSKLVCNSTEFLNLYFEMLIVKTKEEVVYLVNW